MNQTISHSITLWLRYFVAPLRNLIKLFLSCLNDDTYSPSDESIYNPKPSATKATRRRKRLFNDRVNQLRRTRFVHRESESMYFNYEHKHHDKRLHDDIGALLGYFMRQITREELGRLNKNEGEEFIETKEKTASLIEFPQVVRFLHSIQASSTEAITTETLIDEAPNHDSSIDVSSCETFSSHHNHAQLYPSKINPESSSQSIVNDATLPSMNNIGTDTHQLIRNELRKYCTKIDQPARYFTTDERIDEIIRQSLPKGLSQLEDLEDFTCVLQRRKIPWTRVAQWIVKTVRQTWSIDLITLTFALEIVIPYWNDRRAFIDTFRDEFKQLLISILNDPSLCIEEGPSTFLASLMINDHYRSHQTNYTNWISYLNSINYISKRSHQFIHKLLYQFSLADEHFFASELLSVVVNSDVDEDNDEIHLSINCPLQSLPQSITLVLESKLLNVINDPLPLREAIDDRNIFPLEPLIDNIANAIISLIVKPGFAKSLGELCRNKRVQCVANRVREIFKKKLPDLISHSPDCFSRARIIEFLSYLLPSSFEYCAETRDWLEQLGSSPEDKRISLWMLLKYTSVSKQDSLIAIEEELRNLDQHYKPKINLYLPLQVQNWSFLLNTEDPV